MVNGQLDIQGIDVWTVEFHWVDDFEPTRDWKTDKFEGSGSWKSGGDWCNQVMALDGWQALLLGYLLMIQDTKRPTLKVLSARVVDG